MITIGILARKSYDDEGVPAFLIREANLRNFIIELGGTPILLLPQQNFNFHKEEEKEINSKEMEKAFSLFQMCDGLILPGGDDWTYLDELAIRYAIKNNVPILGICLGMQAMGTDGKRCLLEKLKVDSHKSTEHYVHKIQINQDSKLYDILKQEEILVNSRHRFTVQKPRNWSISATSSDGVIEAIEKSDHPFCIGVQWHPEDLLEDCHSKKLLKKFIDTCIFQKNGYNK